MHGMFQYPGVHGDYTDRGHRPEISRAAAMHFRPSSAMQRRTTKLERRLHAE